MDDVRIFENDDLQKLFDSLRFILKDFPITVDSGKTTDCRDCIVIYDNGSWYSAKGHGL